MHIGCTRFGSVTIDVDDILLFPHGLIAFEELRHWVLLADADNDALGWLQNVSRPEVALPVISPRRFVPDYQVRVKRSQLRTLELSGQDTTFVLTIVAKTAGDLTVNLKAPLVINLDRRLGRQVITTDDQPISLILSRTTGTLRKSA